MIRNIIIAAAMGILVYCIGIVLHTCYGAAILMCDQIAQVATGASYLSLYTCYSHIWHFVHYIAHTGRHIGWPCRRLWGEQAPRWPDR